MSIDAVRDYYAQYDEWGRLETPAGKLELRRCLRILNAHLKPHSRILDLGGGPGRYTIELARRGHQMTLLDLSDKHVRHARRELAEHDLTERVDAVEQRDARALDGVDDASFDAVLAFGPFYHLVDAAGRRQAADELSRVLRDEGLAFVQFLPPASGYVRLLDRAADYPWQLDAHTVDRALSEHAYRNPSNDGFQEGYFADADEIGALFEQRGLARSDVMSIRGIAAGREEKLERMRDDDPAMYEEMLELIERTARLPEVIGMGQIALWIGKKRLRH